MNLSDLDDARSYGQLEQQYLSYMSHYFGDPGAPMVPSMSAHSSLRCSCWGV